MEAGGECVHWFNPLAWMMLRKLDEDLKISCDELVTGKCGENVSDIVDAN